MTEQSGMQSQGAPITAVPQIPPGSSTGPVVHTAFLWLKDSARGQREVFIEAAKQLVTIPGITQLWIGPPSLVGWSEPDQSWDVALIIHFASRAAMNEYQTHSLHHECLALSNRIMERFWVSYVDL